MSSPRAFSLIELLVVIGITVILFAIAFPVMQKMREAKSEVACVNNLRQIGSGVAMYAADAGKGDWAYYEARNIANPATRGSWSGTAIWDTQYPGWNGVGKTYPYLQRKELYVCPNNRRQKENILALSTWENPTISVSGSYVARGYDQSWISTTGEVNNSVGRKLSQVSRRAVASCFFMNAPTNPNFPISWHQNRWPVLYGDGSVKIVAGLPPGLPAPAKTQNVWGTTSYQWRFWDHFDLKR